MPTPLSCTHLALLCLASVAALWLRCACYVPVMWLQRLADAFDLLSDDPPDLSGLHILIRSRTALDSQGTLCLDAAADVDDWAAFLGGVDPEYALEKKASAAALRSLEGRVAAAVGVRMLFTAAPYLMTHDYRWVSEHDAAVLVLAGVAKSPPVVL